MGLKVSARRVRDSRGRAKPRVEHEESQETLEASEEESGRTLDAPAATPGSSAYFADAENTKR